MVVAHHRDPRAHRHQGRVHQDRSGDARARPPRRPVPTGGSRAAQPASRVVSHPARGSRARPPARQPDRCRLDRRRAEVGRSADEPPALPKPCPTPCVRRHGRRLPGPWRYAVDDHRHPAGPPGRCSCCPPRIRPPVEVGGPPLPRGTHPPGGDAAGPHLFSAQRHRRAKPAGPFWRTGHRADRTQHVLGSDRPRVARQARVARAGTDHHPSCREPSSPCPAG